MKFLAVGAVFLLCFLLIGNLETTAPGPVVSGVPDSPEPMEAIPICEAYGCDREALRDAVITCYWYDCETGPGETEISEEEREDIRRLAMEGVITGRANEMSTTGNTTIYSFETPDGTYLMSLEFFHGWLVRNDGMYNFTRK